MGELVKFNRPKQAKAGLAQTTANEIVSSVRLAESENQALEGLDILRENVKMVGFVRRGTVIRYLGKGEIAVAINEAGSVVGTLCFHLRRDRVAVVYEIAIAKAMARCGVGSALIKWLVDHARALDAVAIRLKCTEDNDAANKFYAHVGFRRAGEEEGKNRRLLIWSMALRKQSSSRRSRFPKTFAAVRVAEDLGKQYSEARFAIGDALIAECGQPGERGAHNGSHDKLKNCAAELKRLGYRLYTIDHLRNLRSVAANFPHGKRFPSVGWSVHLVAGDPDTLKAAERKASAESAPLTVAFVKRFKKLKHRQQERTTAPMSVDDALRLFRTVAADARELAEDALGSIEVVRLDDVDGLIAEARSVQEAWGRTCEGIRALREGQVLPAAAE